MLSTVESERGSEVVRASASQAVDLGSISCQVILTTLKRVLTASLFGGRSEQESMEKRPESSLVVALGKAPTGIPLSLCG